MSASVSTPQDLLARRVRALLTARGDVREVRTFGGLSFMVDEHLAVAARREGDLLVRTDPARHDELLKRGAAPAYMGKERRPMGPGWLTVPGERLDDEELRDWIKVGIEARNAAD